jgi:enoyl-CoA hydratase
VPAGTTLAKAQEIAAAAARLPPTALKMVKQDVNIAALALAKATAHRDLEAFALMQGTDDFREGVKAFLDSRDPEFTGD